MKKSKYFLLILSLGLSACSRVDNLDSRYEKKFQIPVNANSISVTHALNPNSHLSKSDNKYAHALVEDVEKWAAVRLRPAGLSNTVEIVIQETSISELPNKQNPKELQGRLVAMISLISNTGNVLAATETKVTQKLGIPDSPTISELKTLKQTLATRLIDGLDTNVEDSILKLGMFIHPTNDILKP